jgi:hypothetical protein
MLVSSHDIVVIVALLLYLASLSLTALANNFVCGSLRQHCAGVFAGIVLASSPSSHGRLHATLWSLRRRCCTRPHLHQLRQPTSMSVVITSGVALAPSPSWRWRLCRCCTGVITLVMLASARSRPCNRMRHDRCAGVVVVRGLVAIHSARRLQPCHHMRRCCHAGFVFVHGLIAIHCIVVVVCGGQRRSAMPPAAAADGLGSGNA